MKREEFKKILDQERENFRGKLAAHGAGRAQLFSGLTGRIGVVLSGGGARGAYEAGALLAFQDAGMPTHILAATSVGSINAASYASHSSSLVGNAESLIESWTQVSHPVLTWLSLMLAGISILLLYDQMSYAFYVASNFLRRGHWKPDSKKALR